MTNPVFYPKSAGQTKDDVIELIEERRREGYITSSTPDIGKLTDDLMQKFVDDWHDAFEDIALETGPEAACEEQEKVLKRLAKKIQVI